MKKLLYSLFVAHCSLFIGTAVGAASFEYTRPAVLTNPRADTAARPVTVPVTTTTTTNTTVPEINVTTETTNTVNFDLDAERNACLMGAMGNVWASRTYANPNGVAVGTTMTEAPEPGDNTCFGTVSVKSSEIKDMGRFFPPRYFQVGGAVTCGSWLNSEDVDKAILDAKKGARVAGTIAASIGGAAVGVGVTEAIGSTGAFDGAGFRGQQALSGAAWVQAQLNDVKWKAEKPSDWEALRKEVESLQTACGDKTDVPCPEIKGIKIPGATQTATAQ